MKTTYLLPHKYKTPGWILFILGIVFGIFLITKDYESDFLTIKVLSLFNDSIFGNDSLKFFKFIDNDISDELASLFIIIGGLILGFSKEKIEDEFIYKLRKDSLVWAIIFNYFVLILAIIFVYELSFFHVLVFNMFTPLLFFIIRFNFLKLKSNSHDE